MFLLPATLVTALIAPPYGAVELAPGLSPRFYLGLPPVELGKRQSGICAQGSHSCMFCATTHLPSI